MNPDSAVDTLRDLIDKFTHSEWLSVAITVVVVVAATLIVTKILTKMLRTMLNKGKGPLPSSSIFVNILRAAIWTIAVCIILSSCFNVNVSALITALGVGGIAVSLGFQSTLSNLIGGLQVSLTGLVKPGDHIKVGTNDGIVRDVTWSHTALINDDDETIIIPNSVIMGTAFTRRLPYTVVEIPLYITTIPEEGGLSQLAADIESAVDEALNDRYKVKKPADVSFTSTDDEAFVGVLEFQLFDSREVDEATDVAIRVMAPYVHVSQLVRTTSQAKSTVRKTEAVESALAQQEREEREKRAAEKKQREEARRRADKAKRPLRHRLLGSNRSKSRNAAQEAEQKAALKQVAAEKERQTKEALVVSAEQAAAASSAGSAGTAAAAPASVVGQKTVDAADSANSAAPSESSAQK